jgi:hypothetical protein
MHWQNKSRGVCKHYHYRAKNYTYTPHSVMGPHTDTAIFQLLCYWYKQPCVTVDWLSAWVCAHSERANVHLYYQSFMCMHTRCTRDTKVGLMSRLLVSKSGRILV